MMGGLGSIAFRIFENEIGNTSLKGTERWPVDMMHNYGHARAPRGKASKDTRLSTVGVDNIRAALTKNSG
jgi:hypothetical protein